MSCVGSCQYRRRWQRHLGERRGRVHKDPLAEAVAVMRGPHARTGRRRLARGHVCRRVGGGAGSLLEQDWQTNRLTEPRQPNQSVHQRLAIDIEKALE